MRDQPKPTGEWTPNNISELTCTEPLPSTVPFDRFVREICDAHNAALAASVAFYIKEREQALAVTAGALEQLAAERERRDYYHGETHTLARQLAAEKEKVQTLTKALQQILDAVEHLGNTMEKVGK